MMTPELKIKIDDSCDLTSENLIKNPERFGMLETPSLIILNTYCIRESKFELCAKIRDILASRGVNLMKS